MITLVRGLPGSGKSDKAKEIAKTIGAEHIETDMFWMVNGEYKFDYKRIKSAHAWCLERARQIVAAGGSVVVANTFVEDYGMLPYADLAKAHKVHFEVMEADTPWAKDPKQCFEKCIHNVPLSVIENMAEKWVEKDDLCVIS